VPLYRSTPHRQRGQNRLAKPPLGTLLGHRPGDQLICLGYFRHDGALVGQLVRPRAAAKTLLVQYVVNLRLAAHPGFTPAAVLVTDYSKGWCRCTQAQWACEARSSRINKRPGLTPVRAVIVLVGRFQCISD
jgi:hypothetical protein